MLNPYTDERLTKAMELLLDLANDMREKHLSQKEPVVDWGQGKTYENCKINIAITYDRIEDGLSLERKPVVPFSVILTPEDEKRAAEYYRNILKKRGNLNKTPKLPILLYKPDYYDEDYPREVNPRGWHDGSGPTTY